MPTVSDLLNAKGAMVHTISKHATVLDAAKKMNELRIGALVVVDDYMPDRPIGMFTERDILTRVVAANRSATHTAVAEVMTERILTCTLCTDLEEVKQVMRRERIRHLPVLDELNKLCGMVSLGDLNQAQVRVLVETVQYLEQYSVRM